MATPSRDELQKTMANYRRTIWRLLTLLALLGAGSCCAPDLPPFQTAYSAVGAQVK